jgi:hypothetical protein
MTFYFNFSFDFKSNTSLLNYSFVDVIQTKYKKFIKIIILNFF